MFTLTSNFPHVRNRTETLENGEAPPSKIFHTVLYCSLVLHENKLRICTTYCLLDAGELVGVFNPNHHYYSPILQTRLWKVLKRHQSIVVLSQENVMNTDKSFCCLLTWESPLLPPDKPCRLKRTSIRKNDFRAPPARLGRIGSRRCWLLPSAMDDPGHTVFHVRTFTLAGGGRDVRSRNRE